MTDDPPPEPKIDHLAGAQSLARSIQLLRLVAANSRVGLRIVDATNQSKLARSTAHRLMQALEHEGLIEQDPVSERYFPGIECHLLGLAAEDRFALAEGSLPSVRKLATLLGDTCLLHVRRGDEATCVAREDGNFPIRTHVAHVGDRRPLGVGAGGLAILATLPDEEIGRILHRRAHQLRDDYTLTPDYMLEAVEETRRQGFALNRGRVFPESWAIGVSLIDARGRCRASLSLAGIRQRIEPPRAEELAAMLHKVGAECVEQWAHDPRHAPR